MVIKVDSRNPSKQVIHLAARVIYEGGLVIFPTETVYGLGASAFDARAVRKIFKVKGRPEGKPLIVHVSKKSTIDVLARDIPPVARVLTRKFWPGPLTIVLKRRAAPRTVLKGQKGLSSAPRIPGMVTAGGDTVAVRMPAHRVALALIRAAGPLAAPSANFSGQKPPRSVRDIPQDLLKKADLVLDAGKCPVGVPSTVLDLTVSPSKILREGAIKRIQIEKCFQGRKSLRS